MRVSALGSLAVAVSLLALASPLVKWLIVNGGETGLVRPGAISFCNVLFVGNLVAGALTLALFGPHRIAGDLRRTDKATRGRLLFTVLLAILVPALLFTALQTTTVANLTLLGRMESVFFAMLAILFFGARPGRRQWAGYAIIVVGVLLLVLIQGMGRLTTGDKIIMLAAGLQGLAACVTRRLLERVPVPAFVFVRNFASSIVFFCLAVVLYGFEHFADAFAPGLIAVMAVYALVVVVVGQLAWYRALRALPPSVVVNWSMAIPLLAILFAYLLLGEQPTPAQWIGGAVILTGMIVSRPSRRRQPPMARGVMENSLAAA